MRRCLRLLRAAAGAVRDCDVHLAHLSEEKNPSRSLVKSVVRARRRAIKDLKAMRKRLLRRDKLAKKIERLVATISCPRQGQECPLYGAYARSALESLAGAFFESARADQADDEALHALRIAAKRWRYALELAASALRSPWARELYNALSELQDRLGHVLDYAAVERRMGAWRSVESRRRRQVKLDKLAARHELRLKSLRDDFRRWWTPARRKQLVEQWEQAAALCFFSRGPSVR
jgi:CHAD domain-containing protein